MPALTRRRSPDAPDECWHVYYGDVQVGTIAIRAEARAHFEQAWQVFLSKRTEADFQAWRDARDWTARKYALWDAGKRLPPNEWSPASPVVFT